MRASLFLIIVNGLELDVDCFGVGVVGIMNTKLVKAIGSNKVPLVPELIQKIQ
jgi:hypothetical protein